MKEVNYKKLHCITELKSHNYCNIVKCKVTYQKKTFSQFYEKCEKKLSRRYAI